MTQYEKIQSLSLEGLAKFMAVLFLLATGDRFSKEELDDLTKEYIVFLNTEYKETKIHDIFQSANGHRKEIP